MSWVDVSSAAEGLFVKRVPGRTETRGGATPRDWKTAGGGEGVDVGEGEGDDVGGGGGEGEGVDDDAGDGVGVGTPSVVHPGTRNAGTPWP